MASFGLSWPFGSYLGALGEYRKYEMVGGVVASSSLIPSKIGVILTELCSCTFFGRNANRTRE